jgi:hypothetical protein
MKFHEYRFRHSKDDGGAYEDSMQIAYTFISK